MEPDSVSSLSSLYDVEITSEELENQSILIFNDLYDNSALLGKQRFYSVLTMLTGYRAELFTPYQILNDIDYIDSSVYPYIGTDNALVYLRASNYWYNSMTPYFNLETIGE